MKTFLSKLKNFLNRNAIKRAKQRQDLLNLQEDIQKRAADYKDSNPYLSGVNEGRAQMLLYVIEHIYK